MFKINKTFAWLKSQRQVRGDNRIKQNFEPNVCLHVLNNAESCMLYVCFPFYSKPQRIFSHFSSNMPFGCVFPHATSTHYGGEHHLDFKLLTPLISDYDSLLSSRRCCYIWNIVCLACRLSHFCQTGAKEVRHVARERERRSEKKLSR